MIDRDLVASRLQRLKEYRAALDELSRRPPSDFEDLLIRSAAERLLQLSAQVMIDLGAHVVAGRGLALPEDYRSVFRHLSRAGIIEADLARRLEGWAGFRNLLVHAYADLDLQVILRTLEHELGDLDEFAAELSALI